MKRYVMIISLIVVLAVLPMATMIPQVTALDVPSGATVIDLIAGQHEDVGDISVWNDNDNIYVKYETTGDWYLLETHLHLAPDWTGIPQTKKHNPIPGLFEHSMSFNITDAQQEYSFTIPIPDGIDYGDTIAIAAHAVVAKLCEENYLDNPDAETGDMTDWAYGTAVRAIDQRVESTGTVLPRSGDYFFDMTAEPATSAYMYQTLDVSKYGGASINAGGCIQTELWPDDSQDGITDNDYGWLSIFFWDKKGNYLGSIDSSQIGNPVHGTGSAGYAEFNINGTIPKKAKWAQYKLYGYLAQGSYVNVFYDDLYLEILCTETAWGDGTGFNTKGNWGMWFDYVVNRPPVAIIDYSPLEPLLCEEVTFDGSLSTDPDGDPITYEWDFDYDGITFDVDATGMVVCHTYPAAGTYDVGLRVTDDQGAYDIDTASITIVNNPPYADFDYWPGDPYWCDEVEFDGGWSDDPDWCDSIVLYEWDFDGDGTYDYSDTGPYAYHTYSAAGIYNVELRVTDESGLTDTYTETVTVTSYAPYADFDYSPWDPYWCDEVEFDGSFSYDPDPCDSIVSYEWDLDGDGTYDATGMVVYHTYSAAGSYNVILRVTDESGLTDTYTETVTVISYAPFADFDFDPWDPYWCEEVTFDGSFSSDCDPCDSIVSYEWDLDGDGTYDATGMVVYHTYSAAGTYNVVLRVTDESGLTDTYTETVTVISYAPFADFDFDPWDPYWCEEVEFDGSFSYDPDWCDSIVLYEWDFDGDGTYDCSSTGPYAYHTYSAAGSYNVILRVTDESALTDTYTETVTVISYAPFADFDFDPWDPYWCDEVEFDGSFSYDPDPCDSIVSYEWDLDGDGTYDATGMVVYHTYSAAGSYNVILRVTDESGLTDTYTETVTVISYAPFADFDFDPWDPYWCEEVTFDGSFSSDCDPCDSIVSYEWDLDGDGTYDATGMVVYHTYSAAGTYNVVLRVTDESGLTDTYTETVTVINTPPYADFDYSPGAPHSGEEVEFDAGWSYDPEPCDSIVSYWWDFDNDGSFDDAEGEMISWTFSSPGDHNVGLEVTDELGETDHYYQIIFVDTNG